MRSVRDFGAVGDGSVDDTEAIQHALDNTLQCIYFPPGKYRITKPIQVQLMDHGPVSVSGAFGAAKIIMDGAGPAFKLIGTHQGTADPESFEESIWASQRMPTFANIEIEGKHAEADGVHIEGAMQATFEAVLLRKLRHGIHVQRRARNLLVSHCHIYDNSGVGVFIDHANVHQAIITGSHISYNKLSGIKILNGEVRNVQITGNDIEYNYDRHAGGEAPESAEIWIDTSGEGATIREGTICSNTIQSRYSPGGMNILMRGASQDVNRTAGMFAISGNLIGSQETNVKLMHCRGVTVTGNLIYSGHHRNLHAIGSRNLVVGSNSFDHNPDYLPNELATGVTFERCENCTFSTAVIQDAVAGEHTVNTPVNPERSGLIELLECKRITVNGCQILDAAIPGLFAHNCSYVQVSGCTILDTRDDPQMPAPIRWTGEGRSNAVSQCLLGPDTDGNNGDSGIASEANVQLSSNMYSE